MNISTFLILCGGILCLILPPIFISTLKAKPLKTITVVLLLVYCVVLLIGVWGKLDLGWDTCYVTFDWTHEWCAKTIRWDIQSITSFDLIINLIMLIPVGIALYVLLPKHQLLLSLPIGLIIGILIECSQFVLPVYRSVQLSDALLNMISVWLGACLGWVYYKITNKK